MSDREFWTTTELAEAVGLNSSRIRQLITDEGEIEARKIAGRWLIEASEAERFIEARRQLPKANE